MNQPIETQELGTLKIRIDKWIDENEDTLSSIEIEFGALKIRAFLKNATLLPLIAALAKDQGTEEFCIGDARIAPIVVPARKNPFMKCGMLIIDAETLHAEGDSI